MTANKVPPCPVCGRSVDIGRFINLHAIVTGCGCVDGRHQTEQEWLVACDLALGRALRAHGIETVAQVDETCKQSLQVAALQSDNDRLRAEVVELLWDIVNEQAIVNADGSIYSGYNSTVAGAMLRLGELGLLKITRHEGRGVDAELIKEQP